MAAINRAALREHLWPGIMAWFGMEYQDYPEEYKQIFSVRSSNKAYEEWVAESGFGLAVEKAEGTPITFDEAADTWKGRVDMRAFALGFIVTREAIEDDLYFDLVPKYTRALKRSMRITKEVRAAAFIEGSFSTNTTGDGVSVLNDAHPLKNGDTFSNVSSVNGDLNETTLEAAVIDISKYVDDRGLLLSAQPRDLHIPTALQFTAERLLKTTKGRVGTADNDISAINSMGILPGGYHVNHYLSDPEAWYIRTNIPDGWVWFDRTPLDLEEGDGSETQTLKVMAYERYAAAAMDPRELRRSRELSLKSVRWS